MTVLTALIVAGLVLSSVMAFAAWLALRSGRSGWIDAIWTLSIGVVGTGLALIPLGADAPEARAWLVAALVAVWSLRLGTHIVRRTLKGGDDPRYAHLMKEWGDSAQVQLFVFLQIQAACAFVLVVAVFSAARVPGPLGAFDLVALAIAVAAIVGEAISDAQLDAFKAEPSNQGRVCDVGLWSLSRHPNYFFEWLYWLSYVSIGLGHLAVHPWGLVTLAAPILMYWLLVHASGIPPLEAHMLRSRGDAFRDYQRRVRAFWPIPKTAA